jgi:hypothetical protein
MLRLSRTLGWGALALSLMAPVAIADAPSPAGFPPVVVRTFPAAGDPNVDLTLTEVRVTFSKDMLTHEMWSWVQANPAPFPKIAGKIRYLKDKRTCVLPVALEAGKTYGMWINSAEHTSFRDVCQKPAVPYLLVFKTRR